MFLAYQNTLKYHLYSYDYFEIMVDLLLDLVNVV